MVFADGVTRLIVVTIGPSLHVDTNGTVVLAPAVASATTVHEHCRTSMRLIQSNRPSSVLSGVVREALEDQLNPNTVTISVSEKTHELYMQIFSESNCQDSDFEPYLKKALQSFIDEIIDNKVEKLKALKDKLE